jgi:hypothetical protein
LNSIVLIFLSSRDSLRMSSLGKPMKLVEPGRWRDMSTEDARKILGRRAVGEDVVMAVLVGLGLWGGLEVGKDGSVSVNSKEFRAWIGCLCNRVLDEEACGFISERLKVNIQPEARKIQFELPEVLRENPRLRAARQEAALLNYERVAAKKKRNVIGVKMSSVVARKRKRRRVHRRAASGGTRTTTLLWKKFLISMRIA